MITIKKQQIGILSAFMRDGFEKKAVKHLRQSFPQVTKSMTNEDLLESVKIGIDKAADHHIIERVDVIPFLEYIICLGNDFDITTSDIWIKRTLKLRNLKGSEKILRLKKIKPLKPEFK